MRYLFLMHDTATVLDLRLSSDLIQPVLEIVACIAILAGADDDPGCVVEQVVHLFQWAASGFGEGKPEEERVGQIADDEQVVEFVTDVGHCNGCYLALSR